MSDANGFTGMDNTRTKSASLFIWLGLISAVISLFYFPLLFGALGVVMGILANKRGSRAGVAVIAISFLLMAVGLFYSGVLLTQLRLRMGW